VGIPAHEQLRAIDIFTSFIVGRNAHATKAKRFESNDDFLFRFFKKMKRETTPQAGQEEI